MLPQMSAAAVAVTGAADGAGLSGGHCSPDTHSAEINLHDVVAYSAVDLFRCMPAS
jgi:hypothetical protein